MLTTNEYVTIVNELEANFEVAKRIAKEYEKLSDMKNEFHLGMAKAFEIALEIVKGEQE